MLIHLYIVLAVANKIHNIFNYLNLAKNISCYEEMFYDDIYGDLMNDFYDEIYDDAMNEVYDTYYTEITNRINKKLIEVAQ